MIVFPDADQAPTVQGVSAGIFYNMGQVCTAGTRLYVHKGAFDRIVDGVAVEAAKMKIGPGLDADSRVGPLVSREQLDHGGLGVKLNL